MHFAKRTQYIDLLLSDDKVKRVPFSPEGIVEDIGGRFVLTEEGGFMRVRASLGNARGYAVVTEYCTKLPFSEISCFAPGCWYGSLSTPSKFPLICGIAGGGVDALAAPVVGIYFDGQGIVLADATLGRRETVNADHDTSAAKIILDGRFNLPGLGIRGEGGKTVLFHTFPAQTYAEGGGIHRFTNATESVFGLQISQCNEKDFSSFMRRVWREMFAESAYADEEIDADSALCILIHRVCRSYVVVEGVPEFATDTDHFVPESGFLYRNADLASVLLRLKKRGYSVPIASQTLARVIDYQILTGYAGAHQFFPFFRSRFEAAAEIFDAYKVTGKKTWLFYALAEADVALGKDEYFSVPLLCRAYEATGRSKYLNGAREKCASIWKKFAKREFYGGITDYIGETPLDKESGLLGMAAYLALYETTGDAEDLERAQYCADYAETYHQLQDICLVPYGAEDSREPNMISGGNEHVSTRGIGFVASNCAAADTYACVAAGLYYKLSILTADVHYADYARLLYRNVFLTMNLNDKAHGMADMLYARGVGFFNEYIFTAPSRDTNGTGRGCMHDSDIAWCQYVVLKAADDLLHLGAVNIVHGRGKKSRYGVLPVQSNVPCISDGDLSVLYPLSKGENIILRLRGKKLVDKCVISFAEQCKRHIEIFADAEPVQSVCCNGCVCTVFIRKSVNKICIRFPDGDEFLKQIVLFGDREDSQMQKRHVKRFSNVSVWLNRASDTYYLAGEDKMAWDHATNSYRSKKAEFLRGRLCRLNGENATLSFWAPEGKYSFMVRVYPFETFEGASGSIIVDGEQICAFNISEESFRCKSLPLHGKVELHFSSVGRATVEYSFFRIRNL